MNTTLVQKLFSTQAGYAALLLRVPVGVILFAHGAQKLFGWYGGHGLAGTGEWMASIGLTPGVLMAFLAGSAEFFGGLALILGVLTRPAAFVSAITMVVAIFSVHFANGLFLSNGGYEFGLALLAATAALTLQGAGRFSIDSWIAKKI
ncbi:DoxX family protein [Aliidiomarina celeris]|uniref:DoxX family protein n=1 Tax=Aliidiomarina celeris TaxID=2249428 RepID=UPI000DE91BCC|nr:DoxX family protein [Aliidiomarina celeris]